MGFNHIALQANIQAYRTWAKMCYFECVYICWKTTGATAQHMWDKGVFSLKKSNLTCPSSPPTKWRTWSWKPNRHWAGCSQPWAGKVKIHQKYLKASWSANLQVLLVNIFCISSKGLVWVNILIALDPMCGRKKLRWYLRWTLIWYDLITKKHHYFLKPRSNRATSLEKPQLEKNAVSKIKRHLDRKTVLPEATKKWGYIISLYIPKFSLGQYRC